VLFSRIEETSRRWITWNFKL